MNRHRHEERSILMEVFCSNAKTEQEAMIGIANVEFIEKCLEVKKMGFLIGIGLKRKDKTAWLDLLSQMLDQEINRRYDLDIMPKPEVNINEIDSVTYCFAFRYIKQKGGQSGKPRNHTDTTSIYSEDENSARAQLHTRLSKLKEVLVSEISVSKSPDSIMTKKGTYYKLAHITLVR